MLDSVKERKFPYIEYTNTEDKIEIKRFNTTHNWKNLYLGSYSWGARWVVFDANDTHIHIKTYSKSFTTTLMYSILHAYIVISMRNESKNKMWRICVEHGHLCQKKNGFVQILCTQRKRRNCESHFHHILMSRCVVFICVTASLSLVCTISLTLCWIDVGLSVFENKSSIFRCV